MTVMAQLSDKLCLVATKGTDGHDTVTWRAIPPLTQSDLAEIVAARDAGQCLTFQKRGDKAWFLYCRLTRAALGAT